MNSDKVQGAAGDLRASTGKLAFTPMETCYALGIGRTKLYDLIAQKKLRAFKIGSATRIAADSIHALMAQEAA